MTTNESTNERFPVQLMSMAREAGVERVEVDFEKMPAGNQRAVIDQGLRYFFNAGLSHAAARTRKEANDESAKLSPETIRETVNSVLTRLYSEDFARRTSTSRGPSDPELSAFVNALTPLFGDKAGVLKRKSKNNPEPVTVESLIAAAPGETTRDKARAAYFQVGRDYLTRVKTPAEKIDGNLDKGWRKVVANVDALLNDETF